MRHTKTIPRRRHAQANAVLMFVVLHVGIFGRAQSCGPGYEEINGQCRVCPVGSFKAANGTDMCSQCPLGKFSNRERGLDLMNIESATQTILGASNIQAASITDMCHDPTDQDHIFVVDRSVHVIFRLNVISGSSTHFAGLSGTQEFADGVGTDIRFRQPQAVAASPDGESLFVADTANHRIRRILLTPARWAESETVAGSKTCSGSCGGYQDGDSINARFSAPCGIAVHADNTVFISDRNNDAIRMLTSDLATVTTLSSTTDGGWNAPFRMRFSPEGNSLAVLDKDNHHIKEIRVDNPRDGALVRTLGSGVNGASDGTFATGAFDTPQSLSFSSEGALFVKDTSKIRIVDWKSGTIGTFNFGPGATYSIRGALHSKRPVAGSGIGELYASADSGSAEEVTAIEYTLGATACSDCLSASSQYVSSQCTRTSSSTTVQTSTTFPHTTTTPPASTSTPLPSTRTTPPASTSTPLPSTRTTPPASTSTALRSTTQSSSSTATPTASASTPSATTSTLISTSAHSLTTTPPPALYCQAGSYASEGVCLSCPAFATSPPSSLSLQNCSCQAGYYGSDGQVIEFAQCCSIAEASAEACEPCAPDTYAHGTGSQACTPCPSRSTSLSASAMCQCQEGYTRGTASKVHQGCYIRIPAKGSDGKALRLFSIQIQLQSIFSNSSVDPQSLQDALPVHISNFFLCNQDAVLVASSAGLVEVNVTKSDDYDRFKSMLAETEVLLQYFLDDVFAVYRRRSLSGIRLKVLEMHATCGAGYSLLPGFNTTNLSVTPSFQTCMPCFQGFYKSLTDDSPCVSCAAHATTQGQGAADETACDCFEEYRRANSSEVTDGMNEEGAAVICVRLGQFVSAQVAAETAQAVSAAVGVAVGTNVAVAVGTAVATSVGSALAASSGGAVSGAVGESMLGSVGSSSSTGGTMTMITQVQFLSTVGRIGGSRSSDSMSGYSQGFSWANFELGLDLTGPNASSDANGRRKAKSSSSSSSSLADDQGYELLEEEECGLIALSPPLSQLVTCALVLTFVFLMRNLVVIIITKCIHHEMPPTLQFPAWEAPVFLCQYLAISDSAMKAAALNCTVSWAVYMCITVAFGVPVMFLGFAAYYVRHGVKKGNLTFEYNQSPGLGNLRSHVNKGKGLFAKAFLIWTYTRSTLQDKGSWEDNASSAYWGFLMSDYCDTVWVFSLWVLAKKLLMAMVLNLLDGAVNAAFASVIQILDLLLLLGMRPYVNRKTELTETIGGITNTLSFLSISIPIMAGPHFKIPSWIGDLTSMLLATAATIISAAFSLLNPLSLLLQGLVRLARALGCGGLLGFSAKAGGAAVGENIGNIEDELADQIEGQLMEEEDMGQLMEEEDIGDDMAQESGETLDALDQDDKVVFMTAMTGAGAIGAGAGAIWAGKASLRPSTPKSRMSESHSSSSLYSSSSSSSRPGKGQPALTASWCEFDTDNGISGFDQNQQVTSPRHLDVKPPFNPRGSAMEEALFARSGKNLYGFERAHQTRLRLSEGCAPAFQVSVGQPVPVKRFSRDLTLPKPESEGDWGEIVTL